MDSYELFQRPRGQCEDLCAVAAAEQLQRDPLPSFAEDWPADSVARVLCEFELAVDPRDQSIAQHLLAVGFWEWWVSKVVADVMRPGVTCVDIGANAGYFTALLVGLGARRVLAVEPQPELVRRLRDSIRRNRWDGVDVLELLVSDARGESGLCVPDAQHLGGATMMARRGSHTIEGIPTVPLDELTADLDELHLVKMDAEGAEPKIWAGMQETLRRFPDLYVLAEMTVNRDSRPWLDAIEAAGFPLRYVAHSGAVLPFYRDLLDQEPLFMLYLHRDE